MISGRWPSGCSPSWRSIPRPSVTVLRVLFSPDSAPQLHVGDPEHEDRQHHVGAGHDEERGPVPDTERDQAERQGDGQQHEHQASHEGGHDAQGPGQPDPLTSPISSLLARSISYLISWDTSLAASATRSPSDWPSPAGSGISLRTIQSISLVCGPPSALPHGSMGTRVRLLLGASSCSAKSKASVVVPERSAPRTPCGVSGPVWQEPWCRNGAAAASIPAGRAARYARPNWRPANLVAFTPMCSVSPDCNVTIPRGCTCRNLRAQKNRRKTGRCDAPGNASGAPGRGAAAKPRQAWLPSVHLLCQPGRPLPVLPGLTRLPRLVARGYLAAVPGRVNVRSTFLRRNHRPAKPWRVTNS